MIRDQGNAPGGNPGTYAVASAGTPYLLRVTATGSTRAGGQVDECNTGKPEHAQGTLTLSKFNDPPAVVAPKPAIKMISTTAQMLDRLTD